MEQGESGVYGLENSELRTCQDASIGKRAQMTRAGEIKFAKSLGEAANLLAEDPELALLAGATWIMRKRDEAQAVRYLSLQRIEELREINTSTSSVSIGAMATHAEIANAIRDETDLRALATAAAKSANPGVRQIATLGGNLCAQGFASSDLTPALLALDANVEIAVEGQLSRLPLSQFLAERSYLKSALLTRVIVPREAGCSAHARLTMRAAGDYPVAIVSVWRSDNLKQIRVAIGAVEAMPRRWHALERALQTASRDGPLDPESAKSIATNLLGEIAGRDAVDAPSSYRTRVLPGLVRHAIEKLTSQPRSER